MTFLDVPGVKAGELDTSIEAKINDTGSATRGALNATYAGKSVETSKADVTTFGPLLHKVNGGLTIGFGDSHTAPGELTARVPYWELAAAISQQRLATLDNAGISGNTVQQMLARIDADVINKKPARVIFLAGTNNMADADLAPAWTAYETILDRLTTAGIAVALISIPPQTTAAQTIKDNIAAWNILVQAEAALRGLPYVDIHTPLKDGTGGFQAAYTTDNIHLSQAGALVAAKATWNVLKTVWPATSPVKMFVSGDATSLISNATFADSNADGSPDGWVTSGVGTVGTLSVFTEPSVPGNVLRMTRTASTGVLSAKFPIADRTPGETLEFAVKFRSNSADVTYNLYCTASDTAYNLLLNEKVLVDWTQVLGGFYTAYGRITLPANATRAELVLQTSAGVGTIDWAQPTWRDVNAAADEPVVLVGSTTEPSMVLNPLLADANADTTPENWTIAGNATKAIGTDAAVAGNYLSLTRTDTTTACNVTQDVTTGFVAGDLIELGAKYSLDTAGQVIHIYATCMDVSFGSLLIARAINGESAITSGFKTGTARFTVPANTTRIQFRYQSASGNGTVKFAQATLRKKVV